MKKRMFMIIVLAMVLFYMPGVFAVDITGCQAILNGVSIDARIANIVHTIILVIQIAVPVVLVIFGMLDLFKGITAQKEDEIKKGQQMFVKRLIAAALVFFVVAIVKIIVSFAAGEKDGKGILDCASCFLNGTVSDSSGICR